MDEDWEEYDPNSGLTFADHMVAGSMAGVMEHIAMFPVDTLKTHLQVDPNETGVPRLTVRTALQKLTQDSGMWRLWRGVHSLAIGCVPAHAAYFSIYELAKEQFGANQPGHHPVAAASAGILSVCVHDAVMTPVDVIKQRLQLGYYRGMWDCIKTVTRVEGFTAFFRSYPTTLAMNVPYHAVLVASNESFKQMLSMNPSSDPPLWALLASGAGAGAMAAAATNPLDVVKTRIQTQGVISTVVTTPLNTSPPVTAATNTVRHLGFMEAAVQIFAKDGWMGFSRGLVPRLLVHAPSSAICWTTYELLKQALLKLHARESL